MKNLLPPAVMVVAMTLLSSVANAQLNSNQTNTQTSPSSNTVTLDFDSVPLTPLQCADASEYLNRFGITFAPITPGSYTQICNIISPEAAGIPASPPNVFYVSPPVTNSPVSYILTFSDPLSSISFMRGGIRSPSTGPPWTARAFNKQGEEVAMVGEGLTFGPPARQFTLTGEGIKSLRVDVNNSVASTFNHPPFDDLTLTRMDELPVGGSVTGVSPQRVICQNVTTWQRVVIRDGARSWNCQAAGLVVNQGDIIWQTVIGPAN